MIIGVEKEPTRLHYFPNEKQARKWAKKHPTCMVLVVLDKNPTKIDLNQIWRRNQKLSTEDCRLEWYMQHKVKNFA